jgi:hypothetical protein
MASARAGIIGGKNLQLPESCSGPLYVVGCRGQLVGGRTVHPLWHVEVVVVFCCSLFIGRLAPSANAPMGAASALIAAV